VSGFPLKHPQPTSVVKNSFGKQRRPHPLPKSDPPYGLIPRKIMLQLAAERLPDAAAMTTRLNQLLEQQKGK
jgi:hypothetical protein